MPGIHMQVKSSLNSTVRIDPTSLSSATYLILLLRFKILGYWISDPTRFFEDDHHLLNVR